MDAQDKVTRTDLPKVPFRYIRLDPDNKRFDLGNIKKLRDQIRHNGVKTPVRGYIQEEDGVEYYYITDGKRRYHACKMLMEEGIEVKIPFIREAKNTNREQRAIERIVSNEGKPYNVLELALEVRQLVDWGWEQDKIAEKLGVTANYIRKLILLSNAPMELQNLIKEGKVTGTLAITALEKKIVDKLIARAKQLPSPPTEEEQAEAAISQMGLFSDAAPETVQFHSPKSERSLTEPPGPFPAASPSPAPASPRQGRVTRQDLVMNSWKTLKDHVKLANPLQMSGSGKNAYYFLIKVINNEATPEDIAAFFKPAVILDRSGSMSEESS